MRERSRSAEKFTVILVCLCAVFCLAATPVPQKAAPVAPAPPTTQQIPAPQGITSPSSIVTPAPQKAAPGTPAAPAGTTIQPIAAPQITTPPSTTTQKPAAVTATPATSAAKDALNPNAPPAGTITITSPASGETWYAGVRKELQWTCTGSCSLVDVSLWKDSAKIAVIGTGIGSGHTSYTLPLTMDAGSYELRVTSDYDTGVEGRQPVTVTLPSITVTAPKANEQLYWGSQYTITWTYTGDPGPVAIDTYGGSLSPVTTAGGKGSATWTLPASPGYQFLQASYSLYVQSVNNWKVSAASADFQISCRKALCGSVCADFQNDARNCGWCGHICNDGPCVNGQCVCPSPYPAQCRDKQSAGAAQTKYECPPPSSGKGKKTSPCTPPPPDPPVDISYCVNLQNSTTPQQYVQKDCGSCGNFCNTLATNLTCVNAACVCQAPMAMCGSTCANVSIDTYNCGSCGTRCAGGQFCRNGSCYTP